MEKVERVISILEIILGLGFLTQQIVEAIMRAQIEALIKGQEEEFNFMNKLYKFIVILIEQTNLMYELNTSIMFSTINWENIRDSFDKKSQLL